MALLGVRALRARAALVLLLRRRRRRRPRADLSALVDLRLVAADSDYAWLAGGLDKQRFDDDEDGAPAAARRSSRRAARFHPTLSGHVTLAAYDGLGAAIHATEAYLQFAPVPRSALRFQARVGAFYPPVSLENSGPAWTSPYTLSFSAIDSWLGEEMRTVGAEVQLADMGAFRGSANDFSLTAAVFRFNDPAGALLSWRGWALHDRQTGLFEQLPLAPLPVLLPGGEYYPVQAQYDEPFVELDGRNGWYGARGVEAPRSLAAALPALRQPRRSDGGRRTGSGPGGPGSTISVGSSGSAPRFELLAQALRRRHPDGRLRRAAGRQPLLGGLRAGLLRPRRPARDAALRPLRGHRRRHDAGRSRTPSRASPGPRPTSTPRRASASPGSGPAGCASAPSSSSSTAAGPPASCSANRSTAARPASSSRRSGATELVPVPATSTPHAAPWGGPPVPIARRFRWAVTVVRGGHGWRSGPVDCSVHGSGTCL